MENLWKNWEKHGKFFEIIDFKEVLYIVPKVLLCRVRI